jgi:hypothetical protein
MVLAQQPMTEVVVAVMHMITEAKVVLERVVVVLVAAAVDPTGCSEKAVVAATERPTRNGGEPPK